MSNITRNYPGIDELKSIDFWTTMCPNLSIESLSASTDLNHHYQLTRDDEQRLVQDGYVHCSGLMSKKLANDLVNGIQEINKYSLYPVFIALYDGPYWQRGDRICSKDT